MEQSFTALRRFIRPRTAVERCDLCSLEVAPEHPHLFEPKTRQLQCACDACAILFSSRGDGRYARVPRRSTFMPGFRLTDLQWNSLMLPIQLAFFFNSSTENKVIALYPSPAGATESLLSLEAWDDIVRENPSLQSMQPDVEALLVNRVRETSQYFIAPIDKCYELVGLIRSKWTGLSGGTEVWRDIDAFFSLLKDRSRTASSEVANA
jgi:hypothetical protein